MDIQNVGLVSRFEETIPRTSQKGTRMIEINKKNARYILGTMISVGAIILGAAAIVQVILGNDYNVIWNTGAGHILVFYIGGLVGYLMAKAFDSK